MTISVFDHTDYRIFLIEVLTRSEDSRGKQSRLAKFLKCQTSFLSQVTGERAHLSLEHALRTSEFLEHSQDERHFFMLLVQKGKAGNKDLQTYYELQMADILAKRQVVRERINVSGQIEPQDQMTYYSVWWYLAIHILVALPGFQTRESIAGRLALPLGIVDQALGFLIKCGLVSEESGKYNIGAKRIHLGTGSPMLPRHHANWRMKAIQAVDSFKSDHLHYSAVLGISKKDGHRIRSMMMEILEKAEPIICDSKEEIPFVMLMDFFEL